MKIEAGKKYRTRDGREALVGAYNPFSAISTQLIGWIGQRATSWCVDGREYYQDESPCDLMSEIESKHVYERWVNIAKETQRPITYSSKEIADQNAELDRVACLHIRVEYEDGEGL